MNMPPVGQILEGHQDLLEQACRTFMVQRLSLFGSAVRQDFDPGKSDLDFLVEFGNPPDGMRLGTQFFGFLDELESIFGRRVDLLEASAIENSRLKKSVTSTAVTIYVS